MSTHHPEDTAVSRRRALLIAGAAGLGGAAVRAAATPAQAGDGDPLILGQPNDATATTTLTVAAGTTDPGTDPDGVPGLHLSTETLATATVGRTCVCRGARPTGAHWHRGSRYRVEFLFPDMCRLAACYRPLIVGRPASQSDMPHC
jgi:hypothetical protein